MLGATASFVAMQAVVKGARLRGMSTTDVMLFRTAPGLPVLWWALRRRNEGLVPVEPSNVLVRSLFGSVAMGTNFAAMLWLSLAQFSTLQLLQPVFVALTAPAVLGERIRPSTWLALGLSVTGALSVVVPEVEAHAVPLVPVLLGVSSALASAFAQMWVRKATASDPAERVVFHFAAFVSVIALVGGALRGRMLPDPFDGTTALQIAGMAGFGTSGQVLMTRAYTFGEATPVAMVAYSGLVLSLMADLVVFQLAPGTWALVGVVLMLAAGAVLVRSART